MKSCFNYAAPNALEYLNNLKPTFGDRLNLNQLGGLVGMWMDENPGKDNPTAQQLVELYSQKGLDSKQERYNQTDISSKEDILDLLQAQFFLGLDALSDGRPITKELIRETGAIIMNAFPEVLKENGLTNILENWDTYKELLLKSRLRQLSVPIDDNMEDSTEAKDSIGEFTSISINNMDHSSDEVVYLFASLIEDNTIKGLSKPANFNKTWDIVQNLLKGTSDLPTQIELLKNGTLENPVFIQILDKLGYNDDLTKREVDYNNIRTAFFNSFSKNGYDMIVNKAGKQSYSKIDASLKNSLFAKWKSAFLGSDYSTIIGNKRVFNPEKLDELLGLENQDFLKALGIETYSDIYPPEVRSAISEIRKRVQYMTESKDVTWLLDPILATKKLKNGTDLTVTGSLNKIVEFQMEFEKATRPLSSRNPEGEQQYSVANHNYFTKLVGKLNHGIITANSVLERLFAQGKTETAIIQGMEPIGIEDGKNFNKLTAKDFYTQLIGDMFSSSPTFHLARTADATREIGFRLKYSTQNAGFEKNEDYLQRYMAFTHITDAHRHRLHDTYREDFLKKNHPDWTSKGMAEAKDFWSQILGTSNNYLNLDEFSIKLDEYIKNNREGLRNELMLLEVISKKPNEYYQASFSTSMISKDFEKLSKENQSIAIDNFLDNYIFNSLMYGVESTNMLYGSCATTSPENFFKRTKAGIAEGRQPRTDTSFINHLMTARPSYMNNFPEASKMRIAITSDHIIDSEHYKGINTDDGQGKIVLEAYKEYKESLNEWTDKMNKAFNIIKSGKPLPEEYAGVFTPIKPVGYSLVPMVKDGVTYQVPVFLKCAIYPIYKSQVQGTLNESLYNGMIEHGITMQLPQSGIKIQYPKNLQPQFSETGEFIFNPDATFEFPLEDFRSQVDINPKEGFKQLIGSQIRKLIYSNLFDNGTPSDPKFKEWVNSYTDLMEQLAEAETKKLFNTAGILMGEDGNPYIEDYTKLVKMFRDELLSRNLPINVVDSINSLIDENGNLTSTIDGLPSRQKIMNVLNSIVTNKLIKLNTNGSSLVQISQHGWEMKPGSTVDTPCAINFISKEAKQEYINHGGLKFLTLGEKTGAAHILLPEKYRQYVKADGTIDERILINIGYRIPTQGLNSILHLKVVGFIPTSFGQVVVMPNEITTQGGSDFDVDKLNLFMPNVIPIDNLKKQLSELDRAINEAKVNEEDWFRDHQQEGIDILEKIVEEAGLEDYNDSEIDEILKSEGSSLQKYKKLEKLIKDNPSGIYATKGVKGIQNKIIEETLKVLEMQSTAKEMMTPNSSATLKEEAEVIVKAMAEAGKEIQTPMTFGNMFSPQNLVNITEQMYQSKALVGVFAAQSTHHVLGQQVGLHFKSGRPFYFPHNQVMTDRGEISSLSGTTNKYVGVYNSAGNRTGYKEQLITERLGNESLSASVDAAKDPFLFSLGITIDTGSLDAMYERMGGEPDYLHWLLQQPSVKKYLLENAKSKALSSNRFEKVNKRKIIEKIIGEENSEYLQENFIGNKLVIGQLKARRESVDSMKVMTSDGLKAAALANTEDLNTIQQVMALDDFLYLEDAARVVGKSISTTKFDTDGPGKDVVQSFEKDMAYKQFDVQMSGDKGYTLATMIDGKEEHYRALIEQTILKVFEKRAEKFTLELYQDLVLLQKNDKLRGALMELTRSDFKTVTKALTEDESTLVYGLMINQIIQQSVGYKNELFFDLNTLADRVLQIQKNDTHPLHNNYMFKGVFTPEIAESKGVPSILSMLRKSIDAKEAEFITREFAKIKNIDRELYDDLITANFYQTGVVTSPVSYYNYIPHTDLFPIVQKALKNHDANGNTIESIIDAIMATAGTSLKNIQNVNFGKDITQWTEVLTINPEKSKSHKYVKWSLYSKTDKTTKTGIFKNTHDNIFELIKPQNYKTLFYNLSHKALPLDEDITNEDTLMEEPSELLQPSKQLSLFGDTRETPTQVVDSNKKVEEQSFEDWMENEGAPWETIEWNEEMYNKCIKGKKK